MTSPLTVARKKRGGHRGWATNLVTETEVEESGKLRQGLQMTLVQIESRLRKLEAVQQPKKQEHTVTSAGATAASQPSRVRLPKMDIQKFGGRVCEWQEFWDAFNSCIYENKSLTPVEKFTYLRSYLVDSAKACVAGFALTEANYEAGVELLKDRFGKSVVVKRAHINGLMNLKPVFSESDVSRLRAFYDKVETHQRTLTALGADEESYPSIVVPSLLEKLPETVRLTITRGEDYEEWRLNELIQNLKAEIELSEKHQNLRLPRKDWPPQDGRRPPGTGNNLFTKFANQCEFCRRDHPLEKCTRVTDLKERKNIIRKYARCFNCLKGHRSRDCRSNVKCQLCRGPRNTALCEGGGQE